MEKRIVIYISLLQILVISILVSQLYKKKTQTREVITAVKKEIYSYPKIDGLKYFYEPLPNIEIKSNVDWNNGNIITVLNRTNLDGLNQVLSFSPNKPKNVFRIIILGDSFTFGLNVNTEDNYPNLLQNIFNQHCKNKIEVLNFGVPGYDLRYSVERYKILGQKYNPDLILWFIIGDDLRRINELLTPKTKEVGEALSRNGELQEAQSEGNYYIAWHTAQMEVSKVLGGESKVLDMQKKYLKELNNYYTGPLLIFTFFEIQEKYKVLLQDFVFSNRNTFFYDKIPNINSIADATLPDGHPSRLGHKLIAQNLFEYLKKSKLVFCNEY